ncbi:MAG TPA: hypothetical protein VKQ54_06350, partial [Caulobacteraceae bacterium]|nr:hypothetical protein [Caulobacteraceae bacterium]
AADTMAVTAAAAAASFDASLMILPPYARRHGAAPTSHDRGLSSTNSAEIGQEKVRRLEAARPDRRGPLSCRRDAAGPGV